MCEGIDAGEAAVKLEDAAAVDLDLGDEGAGKANNLVGLAIRLASSWADGLHASASIV